MLVTLALRRRESFLKSPREKEPRGICVISCPSAGFAGASSRARAWRSPGARAAIDAKLIAAVLGARRKGDHVDHVRLCPDSGSLREKHRRGLRGVDELA